MKIIVENKTLKIVENERAIFKGEFGVDVLELYFTDEFVYTFPSITALLSNGRKIGPYSPDEYSTENLFGTDYVKASFTLSKENGFTLTEGKMQITIWLNTANESGALLKKEALGNVTVNVINTTAFDDGDIIISGNVEETLVNYRVELTNLQNQINQTNIELPLIKNDYVSKTKSEQISGGKLFKDDVAFNKNVQLYGNPTESFHAVTKGYVEDAIKTKAEKGYVDTRLAELVNSAPDTLDTLGEIATALEENQDVVDVLNKSVANKADKVYVDDLFGGLNLYSYIVYNNPEVKDDTLYLENGYVRDGVLYLKNAKVENGVLYIDYIE